MLENTVPADMEEMFRAYSGYVFALCVKLGIPVQDAEDAGADIMARLYERDLIGMYDPDYRIERGGVVIPAKFKSFLSHQVALYVRGKRDALNKRAQREPLIIDQPTESGLPAAELLGGGQDDDYSQLSADEFVDRAREYLSVVEPRSSRDKCDLVELFDEMVREVRELGEFTYQGIQQRFSISSTSAYAWVGWLREALASAPAHLSTCHVVDGIVLSEADVARAVKLLRESGGNSVMKPLAAGDHKLVSAEAGWHKELARHEIEQYPELAQHGRPDKRYPVVKAAVIHRLERMLPSGVVVVESAWDPVEAELWRGGADRDSVARFFRLVAEAVESGEAVPDWS